MSFPVAVYFGLAETCFDTVVSGCFAFWISQLAETRTSLFRLLRMLVISCDLSSSSPGFFVSSFGLRPGPRLLRLLIRSQFPSEIDQFSVCSRFWIIALRMTFAYRFLGFIFVTSWAWGMLELIVHLIRPVLDQFSQARLDIRFSISSISSAVISFIIIKLIECNLLVRFLQLYLQIEN